MEEGAPGTPHPSLLILVLPTVTVLTGSSALKLLPQVQIYAFSSTTAMLAVTLMIFIHRCSQRCMGSTANLSTFWDGEARSGTAEIAITTSSPGPHVSNLAVETPFRPNRTPRLWSQWRSFSSVSLTPGCAVLRLRVQRGWGKAGLKGPPLRPAAPRQHTDGCSAVITCGTPLIFNNQVEHVLN